MKIQRISSGALLISELSHVFCCGLPMLVAILNAGTQMGVGGLFMAAHDLIHDYEGAILIVSGALLAFGYYVRSQSNFQITDCEAIQDNCTTQKSRVGWIFHTALVLYSINLVLYISSGHGADLH